METRRSKAAPAEDVVVFSILKASVCSECGAELSKGDFLRMEKEKPLCVECAVASNHTFGGDMGSPKDEVRALLGKLPDDASYEDIQYHLYVLEKVKRGLERAKTESIDLVACRTARR
ncbi:MAG: hypothetical protein HY526_06165 [Betaproteobacteria bacterium]|nr:hypothetical protein [Betaproteobacteria bacterium]